MIALPALHYFAHAIAAVVFVAAVIALFIGNFTLVGICPVRSVTGQSACPAIRACARCLHMVAQHEIRPVRSLDRHFTVHKAVTTPVSTLQVKLVSWELKRLKIIVVGKTICRAAESKIGIRLWIGRRRDEPRIYFCFSFCNVVGTRNGNG